MSGLLPRRRNRLLLGDLTRPLLGDGFPSTLGLVSRVVALLLAIPVRLVLVAIANLVSDATAYVAASIVWRDSTGL